MYRSLLFVPAHIEKYYSSASNSNSDVVIYDTEDSVPTDSKAFAKELMQRKIVKSGKQKMFIRIRHDRTRIHCEDIGDTIGLPIDGYVLPKVECAEDLAIVINDIKWIEKEKSITEHTKKIICIIESPMGLINVAEIAGFDSERVIGIGFGGEDYSTAIFADSNGRTFAYPRSKIIVAAKAYNLFAIDTVYLKYKDSEGFKQELIMNKEIGFDGKFLIHPDQVDLTNSIYSYTQDYVNKIIGIVDKFEKAKSRDNRSVVIIDQIVYEEPHIKKFKKIIECHS